MANVSTISSAVLAAVAIAGLTGTAVHYVEAQVTEVKVLQKELLSVSNDVHELRAAVLVLQENQKVLQENQDKMLTILKQWAESLPAKE